MVLFPVARAARRSSLFSAAALAATLAAGSVAFADPCMDDAFGTPTSCTANDFGLASLEMTSINDDGCHSLGDTVNFDGELLVAGSKAVRYDIGFYIASDSLQAKSGQCTVATIPPGSGEADDGDQCGDFDGTPVSVPVSNVTVACADGDNDGFFDFVVCVSYRQNAHDECAGAFEATPGTASKCNCQRVLSHEPVPPCETNSDCVDDGNACTDEVCNAPQSGVGDSAGCSHEPNANACDDGEYCNGADSCEAGICKHAGNPCELCTESCDEGGDTCAPAADPEACTDLSICRGPQYWGRHGGFEGDAPENTTQDVLDAAGGLQICGHQVTSTSNPASPFLAGLGLDSALEGLCVHSKNVKERRLDRELMATALNCTISGRADCDAFVQSKVDVSFSQCNAVCANFDAGPDAPSLGKCIHDLECFNDGGEIVGGECAFGTCKQAPETLCGGEYGSCPLVGDQPQACVKFEDSCRTEPVCNDALGICPMKSASSGKAACKEAMKNACTVDWCP